MNRSTSCSLLGIPLNASDEEIKRAFKIIAKKHHPDVNGNNELSTKYFIQAQLAYHYLLDNKQVPFVEVEKSNPPKRRTNTRKQPYHASKLREEDEKEIYAFFQYLILFVGLISLGPMVGYSISDRLDDSNYYRAGLFLKADSLNDNNIDAKYALAIIAFENNDLNTMYSYLDIVRKNRPLSDEGIYYYYSNLMGAMNLHDLDKYWFNKTDTDSAFSYLIEQKKAKALITTSSSFDAYRSKISQLKISTIDKEINSIEYLIYNKNSKKARQLSNRLWYIQPENKEICKLRKRVMSSL